MTASPASTRQRRNWTAAVAVGALVVVLVATVIFWIWPSVRSTGSIEVRPASMHCGREVPFRLTDGDSFSAPAAVFAVTLRPDSFCQLEVAILNNGPRAVHADTATFSGWAAGDAGHAPFEITQNGGRFNAKDSGATDEGDAVLPLDFTLEPGDVATELFDLRTRRSMFIGDVDRVITYEGVPRVRVSSGLVKRSIDGSVNIQIVEKK